MPWIKAKHKDDPDGYAHPYVSDDVANGRLIHIAIAERKRLMQAREAVLREQKRIGREDRGRAKMLAFVASELLKMYRGYDGVIKSILENNDGEIQEEIAPYVDRAYYHMEYSFDPKHLEAVDNTYHSLVKGIL